MLWVLTFSGNAKLRCKRAILGHKTCARRTEEFNLQREWIRNKLNDHVRKKREKEKQGRERNKKEK